MTVATDVDRDWLLADLSTVKDMLLELHPDNFIGRISLEGRRAAIQRELTALSHNTRSALAPPPTPSLVRERDSTSKYGIDDDTET